MQNQNQMLLFPSHNAVVVVHHPLHVSADTRSCATRRDICSFACFNAILERSVPTLAGLLRLAGKQQRSEATNQICGFGAPPQTEATKLAPTLMTAAAHHAVVNKFFFSFLAFFPFFGVYEPNNIPMCFGKDKCNFRQVFCVFI
jgi:hypothetical protein